MKYGTKCLGLYGPKLTKTTFEAQDPIFYNFRDQKVFHVKHHNHKLYIKSPYYYNGNNFWQSYAGLILEKKKNHEKVSFLVPFQISSS